MSTREQNVREQSEQAIGALLKHLEAKAEKRKEKKNDLFEEEPEKILLSVGLSRIPEQAFKSFKGKQIALPNPWNKVTAESELCLIAKNRKEAELWLEKANVKGVAKVVDLHEIRTKYNAYSERRELLASYDAFLADDRIVNMLPKALGKVFYKSRKRPVPLRLAQRNNLSANLQKKIEEAVQSTYFYFAGSCSTLPIGLSDSSSEELVENIMAAIDALCVGTPPTKDSDKKPSIIPGGWKGVQSLHIKSNKSVSLPIYQNVSFRGVVNSVDAESKKEGKTSKKRSAESAKLDQSAKVVKKVSKKAKEAVVKENKKSNDEDTVATPTKTTRKTAVAKSTGKKVKATPKTTQGKKVKAVTTGKKRTRSSRIKN